MLMETRDDSRTTVDSRVQTTDGLGSALTLQDMVTFLPSALDSIRGFSINVGAIPLGSGSASIFKFNLAFDSPWGFLTWHL